MSKRTAAYGLAVAGIVTASVATGTAWANWDDNTSAVTAATASSRRIGQVAAPLATLRGHSVQVRWTPLLPAPQGYFVLRYAGDSLTPLRPGGSCANLVRSGSCTDAAVPSGQWRYVVYAVTRKWTGARSDTSPVVTLPMPRTPRPVPAPKSTPTASPPPSAPASPTATPAPLPSVTDVPSPAEVNAGPLDQVAGNDS